MKNAIFLLAIIVMSSYSYSQTTTNKVGKLKVLGGNAMHYTRIAAASGSGVDSIAIPVFSKGSIFEIGTNKIICDSAIVDIYNDSMTAYNVIITSSSTQSITGSYFVYNDKTQNGIL